jgi:hypothetical protein
MEKREKEPKAILVKLNGQRRRRAVGGGDERGINTPQPPIVS